MLPSYRVSAAMPRWPYRDDALRERYGQHLIAAGLPPLHEGSVVNDGSTCGPPGLG
jgi:hypothetical protein